MTVKPNTPAALEFLRRYEPDGPWVLTAIQPDRKAISTRTFHVGEEDAMGRWIADYNGDRNIYFHVNPVIRDVIKKAEREDIKSVSWLHVDIDPRAGEDIEAERRRALGLLTTNLPKGVPPPTVVIFSGGGYQGFWKLEIPIPVNGDLALAEDAKRYNQQLELLFGADNVHNIDRIMRLPGTINLPDARKLKKGRRPALAELVEFDESRVYPISRFTPAAVVQMPDAPGFSTGQTVRVSGNVERINDVSELDQWNVPDRIKVIIVQGNHPDETKKGDASRSAWLFDVICGLVRCEVPDDVIFSIVTDPEFGISESVLDKGRNAERYAIRQIERGKEEAIDPWLRELNEKFAVIGNIGGKCRVVEEVLDATLDRTRLTRQSFDDFQGRYRNKHTQVGVSPQGMPIMKPVGKFWLDHPNRRQYDTVVFAPDREVPNAYNLWRGFGCAEQPGDCSLYLEHVRENICGGDPELYDYLIRWMARAVQHPGSTGEVAIVLRGGQGTGKSFFAKEFGKLFGRHFLQVSNSSHLVGNFNSHLRDVVVLFADEAFYAGDKRHTSVLKTLVTESTIVIEAKGVDAETAPNYVHLIMASNDQHVIPAGGDERRFLVLDVGKGKQQNTSYFGRIAEQMDNGGREALLHYLRTLDLDGWKVQAVPKTAALQDQKHLSYDTTESWWFEKLQEGRILETHGEWEREVRKHLVQDDFVDTANKFRVNFRGTQTSLGKFLARVCPGLKTTQKLAEYEEPTRDGYYRMVTKRTYFWEFPTLAECRARWEELYGAQAWPEYGEEPRLSPGVEPF